MKNKILWILLALVSILVSTSLNATQENTALYPSLQQARAAHLAARVLSQENYEHLPFDDKLSSTIFDNYLKDLDDEKVIFLQSDVDQFEISRTKLGPAILDEDLTIPFAMFNLRQQRIAEHLNYSRSLLTHKFNFEEKESYQPDRKHAAFPQSDQEMNDLWRKRVKNDWLRLKLAGKDDKSIIEILDKRYDNSLKSMLKIKGDDVFQIFMDAYALAYDPHTNYFGVRAAESFDISMKLSLTGIGAELQNNDEYVTIRHLVPGSPAELSKKLKAGDRIVSVGQGADGPTSDILGMSVFDAVTLIRGAEDSTVRLEILPAEAGPDGKLQMVTLVRKKITLENQSAKKSVVDVQDGATTHHIGVISLPGFYRDFAAQQNGDKDFKSAARDVSRILDEFTKEHVDGVVLDLRNNGGGSVEEAIELIGLFVDQGPVMQQVDAVNRVSVNDIGAGQTAAWKGPFGVLINRASASASEIFAAAIQDYGRGVVIGETSFGKGSTQAVVNLDKIAKSEQPDFGELKMTVTTWFRINGDAIQLRGVTPDITLPMLTDAEDFGESSYDNALPWKHIAAADYKASNELAHIVPTLILDHNARTSKDQAFKDLADDIAEFKTLRKKNLISLNEDERRKEREAQEAKVKRREAEQAKDKTGNSTDKQSAESADSPHEDDGLLATERKFNAEKDVDKKDDVSKDVLLKEAAHIIDDEAALLKSKS